MSARWLDDLQRERRVGVPHFRVGQIKAWRPTDERETIGFVRFVDRLGHAWLVCCDRETGDWIADLAVCVTANGNVFRPLGPPPPAFRFTPALLDALDNAERTDVPL